MKDDKSGDANRGKELRGAPGRSSTTDDQARQYLKILLLHLAAKYENPGKELHSLLQEVLRELHGEVKSSLRPNLKLV